MFKGTLILALFLAACVMAEGKVYTHLIGLDLFVLVCLNIVKLPFIAFYDYIFSRYGLNVK